MKDSSMKISVMRGAVTAIIIFVLNKLFIAAAWALNASDILWSCYYIALIVVIGFGIRGRIMKYYCVSLICFTVVSVLIAIAALIINIDKCIFETIFGSVDKMWAGDGFMLVVVFMSTLICSAIGMVISFVKTLIYQKRGKLK